MICFLLLVNGSSAGIGMWYPEIQNRLASTTTTDKQTVCDVLEQVIDQRIWLNGTLRQEVVCDDSVTTQTFVDMSILGSYYTIGYILYAVTVKAIGQGFILGKCCCMINARVKGKRAALT